jgi:hypothetical protein
MINYKINDAYNDFSGLNPYVVIIGASNSLMKDGWGYFFKKEFSENYDVINLSLGATSSVYISYVVSQNKKLLSNAKFVIFEPFVNDVSFYKVSLSHTVLELALSYYYSFMSTVNSNFIVLLLPTKKRINNISANNVYKMHLFFSKFYGAFVVDCHPFFYKNGHLLDHAFKDDAHLSPEFSFIAAKNVAEVINSDFFRSRSRVVNADYEDNIKVLSVSTTNDLELRNSSYFSVSVSTKSCINIKMSRDYILGGILHWFNMQNNFIDIFGSGFYQKVNLRSVFLKMSSFPFLCTGPVKISLTGGIGVSEVVFFKRKYLLDSMTRYSLKPSEVNHMYTYLDVCFSQNMEM